ncbi:MAG TPA: UDP-N-acetylglucosamine--N-acetylmuramyl-(pentapeptide) pyrophosphoryl-undecaprenol N-acetylglucosamine transferase [Tepidisphaeraceae bacterium]|nr:UDP-N-acetylglucosamine--N-acetylmuramyl-(pentapeptide) pyrophosphoryl-undecaprenol N-acetylglucosamine transferase [Tepidisphaeraceae bacterium]
MIRPDMGQESDKKLIVFAGGGTGGHLYPGIAVAEALRTRSPDTRVLFLCTTRDIDRVILQPTGFEFIEQPIERPTRSVGGLLRFWKSWRETKELVRRVLKERKPDAVVGLGGYAAGVGVKLAAADKIPTALINPDVIPGKANQYLMKHAAAVCCQFEQTAQHVSSSRRAKLRVTGCPIRSDITALPPKAEAVARLGLDPLLNTLMITGASQGAQTVNEGVTATLAGLDMQGWQVLHLSGRAHADAVREAYRKIDVRARVVDFTPAMADVWAATDLTVSRSGASTCAELTACGIPSILMPYPFHKDQHQRLNAKVLADAGAAVLVDDERDAAKNSAKLKPALEQLLFDAGRRRAMGDAARAMGKPGAADEVATTVLAL